MKFPSIRLFCLSSLALIFGASLVAQPTDAPKKEGAPKSHEISAKTGSMEPKLPILINIDFRGGSLRDFVNQVSTIKDVSLNLVGVTKELENAAQLPPFSLRNAHINTVVQVVRELLEPQHIHLNVAGHGDNSIVAVVSHRPPPTPKQPEVATLTEPFQLEKYLAAQSVDDIVGAIRMAWESNPIIHPDSMRLKFHPGTSILIVSGPPYAIEVARKVISSLKIPPTKAPAPPPAK